MRNLISALNLINAVAPWISSSFRIIRVVLIALIIILSVSLVVIILLQPAKQEGVGAISGGSDTFFSKNKGRTREGMLMKMTIIWSLTILGLALLYFVTLIIDQRMLGETTEIFKLLKP